MEIFKTIHTLFYRSNYEPTNLFMDFVSFHDSETDLNTNLNHLYKKIYKKKRNETQCSFKISSFLHLNISDSLPRKQIIKKSCNECALL